MTAQDYCLWDDPLCYAKEKSPSIWCYLLLLFFHQFPLKLESEFYVWQLGNVCPPGRMIWSFGFSEKKCKLMEQFLFGWNILICWFFWKYKRATFFFFFGGNILIFHIKHIRDQFVWRKCFLVQEAGLQFTLTCLVLLWKTGFAAMWMAAWLLQRRFAGRVTWKTIFYCRECKSFHFWEDA